MVPEASITQLLVKWSHGDQAALEELTPHVHRELQSLARAYLRRGRPNQTLQPTAVVNEELMRLVLVDYARAHHAAKREGAAEGITLHEAILLAPTRAPDVLEVNEALDHLAKVDERKAKVI